MWLCTPARGLTSTTSPTWPSVAAQMGTGCYTEPKVRATDWSNGPKTPQDQRDQEVGSDSSRQLAIRWLHRPTAPIMTARYADHDTYGEKHGCNEPMVLTTGWSTRPKNSSGSTRPRGRFRQLASARHQLATLTKKIKLTTADTSLLSSQSPPVRPDRMHRSATCENCFLLRTVSLPPS